MIQKRIYLFITICIQIFTGLAVFAQNDQPLRKADFTENWQFHLAIDKEDSINVETSWRNLNLPHDWSIEQNFNKASPTGSGGGSLSGGLGWYKKTFQISESERSKRISILFDGIYENSSVWINGHFLGKRPNGYLGFEYDLTPYLHYGKKSNELLVKVNNVNQPNSRWYSGSGIYRNVWLKTTDKLYVPQWGTYVTTPEVNQDKALVVFDISLKNEFTSTKNTQVKTTLWLNGEEVNAAISEVIELKAAKKISIQQKVQVTNPILWSLEKPQIYTAVTEVISNGKTLDRYKTPFGIREFKFDLDKGFILNGKQIKIKGVCMHHDLGPLGAAINTRAITRQLEILKDMGVNGIRTAHNPPAPELLDLCDTMGFIVMDEAFDIWENQKTKFDYAQNWERWYKKDLEDQILRDRNHPSLFMWSIGNEVSEQWSDRGAKIGRDLATIVKTLDTTRLVTAGMNPPIHTNAGAVTLQFEETADKPNALAGSGALDLIGYNYAHQTYEKHKINFPNTPFIATETTSGLMTRGYYEFPSDTTKIWPVRWDLKFTGGNSDNTVSAFDQVRTPWGSLHETTWKIIKKHDYLSGFFIWTGFDYLGEPTPYTWPSRSSYFGIVDLAGFPKDVYYMYKSEWTKDTVLHVLPHWNWDEGQLVDVWAYYNNADEVELFLNGKSKGTKQKIDDELHVMWRFPFEAGILKAVSRKEGKVIKETHIQTAGEAAKLRLTADRNSLKATGKDLAFITVEIIDGTGILAPKAGNNIQFSLEGNGEIIGVSSGDPTNHQSFKGKEHRALNGKCLVVVQTGKVTGNLKLTALAEGLEKTTITLHVE
ncbi:sugar-binding domain-containing protein [Leeuwenhoekiella marinoflava]|uniref:sugar-binding domain-containing protein n=1 Tax=Leeuwenhoekiella marinoflava TaxID=988 RepID=UPI0030030883